MEEGVVSSRSTRLVALVRDPTTLFLYWEIGEEGYQSLAKKLGLPKVPHSSWRLLVEDLDYDHRWEHPISIEARNWYLSVSPDRRYILSLGARDALGHFHTLVSTSPLHTPSLSYSRSSDAAWPIPEDLFLRLLALGFFGFLGGSGSGRG